jgi:Uma2 family endonuclease
MAAVATNLVSFAEFELLQDPPSGRYELRSGEVVLVPPPKLPHYLEQLRLRDLLSPHAPVGYIVGTEFAYRPSSGYDYLVADVAIARLDQMTGDYFDGAPLLAIEILSPSNTAREMLDKEQICLENGAQEFWVVDDQRKQVKVTSVSGHTAIYKTSQQIPLFFAPGQSLPVDAIFDQSPQG